VRAPRVIATASLPGRPGRVLAAPAVRSSQAQVHVTNFDLQPEPIKHHAQYPASQPRPRSRPGRVSSALRRAGHQGRPRDEAAARATLQAATHVSGTGRGQVNAFWRAPPVLVSPGSHPGFVISERFKSGFRAALIQPLPVLNRAGPELSAGNGELSAVQLRLASIDAYPILQVGQMRRRRFSAIDRAAQGVQKRPLPGGITVSVLGQQPRRPGTVLTGQRPAWPAPGAEKFAKPPGGFLHRCAATPPPPRPGAWSCTVPVAGIPGRGSADPHRAGPAVRVAVLHPRSHSTPAAAIAEDAGRSSHDAQRYERVVIATPRLSMLMERARTRRPSHGCRSHRSLWAGNHQ
jgi:hypothetical protein